MSIFGSAFSFYFALGKMGQTAASKAAGRTAGSLVDAADGMRDAHE